MTANPSLTRFLLERIDEEITHMLLNTPVFLPREVETEVGVFIMDMLDRGRLYTRLNDTKQMVLACTVAAKEEQDDLLIHDPDQLPATRLGDFILKTLAARYGSHPDYSEDWVTEERFGVPH